MEMQPSECQSQTESGGLVLGAPPIIPFLHLKRLTAASMFDCQSSLSHFLLCFSTFPPSPSSPSSLSSPLFSFSFFFSFSSLSPASHSLPLSLHIAVAHRAFPCPSRYWSNIGERSLTALRLLGGHSHSRETLCGRRTERTTSQNQGNAHHTKAF